MEEAAKKLCEEKPIKGFRPGRAPYDLVISTFGEMKVLQNATNRIIGTLYYETLDKEKLDTVDQPDIEIKKMAPGNAFVFTAKVSILPEVKVCDLEKIRVSPISEIKIDDAEINKVLADIQKIRAKEVLVDRAAQKADKVELDFETFMDKVPLDGGKANKHSLIIGEGYMIPGFEDNLVGLKKDEQKEFELNFPDKYHAKHLAGKKALFKVKVLAVYAIEQPKIDDELAKGLGYPDLTAMKKSIESNIKRDKENKAREKQELEIIEKLIDKSTFGELPDALINNETHKMMHELESNVERQGGKLADYLSHIKKTEEEMLLEFTPDAIKRVKTALIIRAIAQANNLTASHDEVHEEMEKTIASYKLNPAYANQIADLEKNMHSEHAHAYFSNIIANRKTMEFIKNVVVKA
jgi:trigger factor